MSSDGQHGGPGPVRAPERLAAPAAHDGADDEDSSGLSVILDGHPDLHLGSDIVGSEALALLQGVQTVRPEIFGDFNDEELALLAQFMSILHCEVGDQIIESGEVSSWCGIVLDGRFEVDLFKLKIHLEKGAMMGEMNYFDGGERTASVCAATEGAIAVITYEELDHLRDLDAQLALKFTVMLCKASITVLKKIGERASKKAGHADEEPEDKALSSNNRKARGRDKNKHDKFGRQHRAEILFRSRLKQEELKTKRVLQKAMEQRLEAEHAIRNHQYQLMNRDNRIRKLEEELEDKTARLDHLSAFRDEAAEALTQNKLQLDLLGEKKAELENAVEFYRDKWEATKDELHATEQRMRTEWSSKVEAERARVLAAQADLEEARRVMREQDEAHRAEMQRVTANLSFVSQRKQSVAMKFDSFKHNLEALHDADHEELDEMLVADEALRSQTAQVRHYKQTISDLQERLEEMSGAYMQKNAQLNSAVIEAQLREQEARTISDKYTQLIDEMQRSQSVRAQASAERAEYEALVKNASVQQYIQNWRVRRHVRNVHKIITSLVGRIWKEIEDEKDLHVDPGDMQVVPQPTHFIPRGNMQMIIDSLQTEADKLHALFDEVARQKTHWKFSCNNFFKAHIEARRDVLEMRDEYKRLKTENAELREQLATLEERVQRRAGVYAHVSDEAQYSGSGGEQALSGAGAAGKDAGGGGKWAGKRSTVSMSRNLFASASPMLSPHSPGANQRPRPASASAVRIHRNPRPPHADMPSANSLLSGQGGDSGDRRYLHLHRDGAPGRRSQSAQAVRPRSPAAQPSPRAKMGRSRLKQAQAVYAQAALDRPGSAASHRRGWGKPQPHNTKKKKKKKSQTMSKAERATRTLLAREAPELANDVEDEGGDV